MIYIFEVEKTDYGDDYYVIDLVRWNNQLNADDGYWWTKQEMVKFMLDNPYIRVKTKYKKYGVWIEGEDVRVINRQYIRTDANNYRCDNLGNL